MTQPDPAIKRLCVYCGSRPGSNPAFASAASSLGSVLAREGIGVVMGGGRVGLMGFVANAALDGGGEAIGVIPRALAEREVAHTRLTALHVVETMHERKAMMESLADAFVALPGGLGTLEEIAEILTWSQLGIHSKPCALLNVEDFYTPFVNFLDHASDEGFILAENRRAVIVESDPERLVARLRERTQRC